MPVLESPDPMQAELQGRASKQKKMTGNDDISPGKRPDHYARHSQHTFSQEALLAAAVLVQGIKGQHSQVLGLGV